MMFPLQAARGYECGFIQEFFPLIVRYVLYGYVIPGRDGLLDVSCRKLERPKETAWFLKLCMSFAAQDGVC